MAFFLWTESGFEMNDLDRQIRDHFAGQSLDPAAIERMKRLIEPASPARRIHWPRYAAAAIVLVTLSLSAMVYRSHSAERQSQLASAEMVQQHRQPFSSQFAAEDFASLKGQMTQLAFAPAEPERLKDEEYRVVGARYATLAGQQVAQIRLAYTYGTQATLYEMKEDQLPALHDGKSRLDGVSLTVWHEGGLKMALAGEVTE